MELNQYFIDFIKKTVKFCCFSSRNDSILMWSHYADRHCGICVEYDFTEYELINCLYPVVYSDEMMDITPLMANKNLNWLISILAVSQKAKDWAYENEWRLAIGHDLLRGNTIKSPKPVRIFTGVNISEKDKNDIMKLANAMGIEVCQMKKEPNSFKIIAL